MKARIARVGLAGALLLAVSAPFAQQASAAVCYDEVTYAYCLVAGTACGVVDKYVLPCQLG